jgi:DNA-directed RNA polymerase specialized sigma24 family protein
MAEVTKEMRKFGENMVRRRRWDEDYLQDLYVEILERKEPVTLAWFIMRYPLLVLDSKRKEFNRQEILKEMTDKAAGMLGDDEYYEDPADLLEHEQEVFNKLRDMTTTQLRTLGYLYLDGLTPEETAAKEGVERNAIDQRVHNIKRQLKGETQ